MYVALKNLTIDGREIRKGDLVPDSVPAERLANGLRMGSIGRKPADPAASKPAKVEKPKQ